MVNIYLLITYIYCILRTPAFYGCGDLHNNQPLKTLNILIVTSLGVNLQAAFSKHTQAHLAKQDVKQVYSVQEALDCLFSDETYELLLCSEDLPMTSEGKIEPYSGYVFLAACARVLQNSRYKKVRIAMQVREDSHFYSQDPSGLNMKDQKGTELCYLFTSAQLSDVSLRRSVEFELFKTFEHVKDSLPKAA